MSNRYSQDGRLPEKRAESSGKRGEPRDDEQIETKKFRHERITWPTHEAPKPVRSYKEEKNYDRLKKAAMKYRNGFCFDKPEDAIQFVLENRKENLFVRSSFGKNAFLVRVSYELAAAGKKVLFLYDGKGRRMANGKKKQPKITERQWKYEFEKQAEMDPVKKAMVCETLEDVKEGKISVKKAIEEKRILTGNGDDEWFSSLVNRLMWKKIFVPDTVIMADLDYTAPETFLKFLEHWQIQIIGSYKDAEGNEKSAAEFVRDSGDRLNHLLLGPLPSSDSSKAPELEGQSDSSNQRP